MIAKTITYVRTKLKEDCTEKIGITVEIEPGEKVEDVLGKAKLFVAKGFDEVKEFRRYNEIETLQLPARAYNALVREGITTIDRLLKNETLLPQIRNLGSKSVQDVKKALEELGLEFKKYPEELPF